MIDSLTLIIILVAVVIAFFIGQKIGAYRKHKEWEEALPDYRKDAIMKSRAVLGGQFSEQLAPYLPNFKYLPTECRFIGKPIDLMEIVEGEFGEQEIKCVGKCIYEYIDVFSLRKEMLEVLKIVPRNLVDENLLFYSMILE